jgi:hypothetical protein
MSPWSVDLVLSEQDVTTFAVHALARSPLNRTRFLRARLAMFTVGPVALAIYVLPALLLGERWFPGGQIPSWPEFVVLAVVLGGACGGFAWWWQIRSTRKAAQAMFHSTGMAPFRRPCRLTIDEKGVTWTGEGVSSELDWTRIQWLETTAAAHYLYTSPQQAFIVPRSAFESGDAFARFGADAEHFWRAGRENAAA